jgi:superfamily I DNA/RNA helicase
MIKNIGIFPSTIMAVTFTNKAAKEMKKRVANTL